MPTLRNASPSEKPSLRARAADALVRLGGRLHHALVDLALYVDPRLGLPIAGPVRPWAGIVVIVLLVAGVALVSGGAVWAVREALPHREWAP